MMGNHLNFVLPPTHSCPSLISVFPAQHQDFLQIYPSLSTVSPMTLSLCKIHLVHSYFCNFTQSFSIDMRCLLPSSIIRSYISIVLEANSIFWCSSWSMSSPINPTYYAVAQNKNNPYFLSAYCVANHSHVLCL